MTNTNIQIDGFITNLGKYNEGQLIGKWVTFPLTDEEIKETFEEIGINEQYEEYFFTDWESDALDLYNIFGEYANIKEVNELAEELEDVDDIEKLIAILETQTSDIREALDSMDEYTFYENMTLEDVAYELVEDCYDLPEFALRYFDYDAFTRDLSFDGYTETSNGVLVC